MKSDNISWRCARSSSTPPLASFVELAAQRVDSSGVADTVDGEGSFALWRPRRFCHRRGLPHALENWSQGKPCATSGRRHGTSL